MTLRVDRRHFLAATAAFALPLGQASAQGPDAETARLNGWLEDRYQFWLNRSPMTQAYLGLKTNLDKWDEVSEAREAEDLTLTQDELAEAKRLFSASTLTPQGQLSYRLYVDQCERRIGRYRWRFHSYPVNQMFGWQQEIPTFLMNIHRVADRDQAEAYIARLAGIPKLIDQVIERMRMSEARGVLAPKFVYANVLRDCRNVIAGAPFGGGKASPLLADITGKIGKLDISEPEKRKLRADALRAVRSAVGPAYRKLIATVEGQSARAGTADGVWHLPDGDAYYAFCLKDQTTTDMTAAEIHAFGLEDVARIRDEMEAVKTRVKFKGSLKEFFEYMRTDAQFYYPQTEEGKAAYLADAQDILDTMKARLDELFITKPKAELVLKAVEPFREQSATSAFYEAPGAFDGRPGVFYVNTFDMHGQPKYEMESLAYHEAIPGHHMQISIAQELQDMPKFRRFGGFTAYIEGWGLYCERMPKEMGFYKNPYSDFGRLTNELWRACRLVVDTGLHGSSWKWGREQAIAYLEDMTPNAAVDCVNSVERYIVMPGQATSYKIGMTKIIELREAARKFLGSKFDLREFHDVVLGSGALPLDVLAEVVATWVIRKQTAERRGAQGIGAGRTLR